MSTKPTTVPRWATDLTNNTVPLSGQQDTGWTVGQDGVSSYDNWFKYWCYKWFQWLDEGNISFADLTVSGSTVYTGAVDYSWTGGSIVMDPQGSGDVDGIHTIYAQPTNLVVHALHGLVAGTDGQEIDIINDNDTYRFYLVHDSGTAAAGQKLRLPAIYTQADASGNSLLVSTRGSIRLRYNGTDGYWEIIRTNGCYAYRTIGTPAYGSEVSNDAFVTRNSSGTYNINSGPVTVYYPLSLIKGSIIDGATFYIHKATDNTNTITVKIQSSQNNNVAPAAVGSNTNNANSPGATTIPITASGSVSDLEQYWLEITQNWEGGGSGTGTDIFRFAQINVWMPI